MLLTNIYFYLTKSRFLKNLGCKQAETQTDCYWFGFSFPVPGCGVKIMQQRLTAWTQTSIQEAQLWLSHRNICQLGCRHLQACTVHWFLPILYPKVLVKLTLKYIYQLSFFIFLKFTVFYVKIKLSSLKLQEVKSVRITWQYKLMCFLCLMH